MHPLTEQDKKDIDAGLAGIKQAREIITRAKLANIDVSTEEAILNEKEAKLKAIKAAFFPA